MRNDHQRRAAELSVLLEIVTAELDDIAHELREMEGTHRIVSALDTANDARGLVWTAVLQLSAEADGI